MPSRDPEAREGIRLRATPDARVPPGTGRQGAQTRTAREVILAFQILWAAAFVVKAALFIKAVYVIRALLLARFV